MQNHIYVILCCLLCQLSVISLAAQDYYWVAFSDKNYSPYSFADAGEFLSDAALLRRERQGIAIDSTDLPVNPQYIEAVVNCGCRYVHQSKWLNGITVIGDSAALSCVRALAFVSFVERTSGRVASGRVARSEQRMRKFEDCEDIIGIGHHHRHPSGDGLRTLSSDDRNRGLLRTLSSDNRDRGLLRTLSSDGEQWSDGQNNLIGAQWLLDRGFRGRGMRIAILDTGFPYCDTEPSISSKIREGYNIAYPGVSVYDTNLHHHGALCLSIMAAEPDSAYTGTAPDADYYLFVTEIEESESLLEIDHWVRAVEMADSIGVDIVSSSLGYSDMDDVSSSYRYEDMDGKTVRCSRAAAIAAQRGMVVCVSAGNDGNKAWHYITAPADADGILTVGGVTIEGEHSVFSSFGPTSDGRIKPDVCAQGTGVFSYINGYINRGNGTSFACPQIAGAAASLWAALPDLSGNELVRLVIESASEYTNPNDSLGYGIADFRKAYYMSHSRHIGSDYIVYRDGNIIVENTVGTAFDMRLYDMSGRLVISSSGLSRHEISCDRLPRGVYIMVSGEWRVVIAW